jgi:hypothetical protein
MWQWFDEACWDSNQPCEGRTIDWLPWAVVELIAVGLLLSCVCLAVRFLVRR